MTNTFSATLLVGVGGFAGSVARYGLSQLAQRLDASWPAGTLAANWLGCLVIGMLAELATRGSALTPEARLFLAVGFCGGFTTLSSLIYELMQMLRAGSGGQAALYLGATLLGAIAAFVLGVFLMRQVGSLAEG